MSADKLTDAQINALISKSEVHEYHPGAILEFAREVIAAHQAQPAPSSADYVIELLTAAGHVTAEQVEAARTIAAKHHAPQPSHVPTDPDGEKSRSGFRAFDESQIARWATPWQVWREAVKWAAQQGDKTP